MNINFKAYYQILIFLFLITTFACTKSEVTMKKSEVLTVYGFSNPEASPVKNEILFSGRFGESTRLYLLKLNEGLIVELTDDFVSTTGSFSKDGRNIIYSYNQSRKKNDISDVEVFLMNANDYSRKRLTNDSGPNYFPIISENKEQIFYMKSEEFTKIDDLLAPIPSGWYDWNIYRYDLNEKKEYKISNLNNFSPGKFSFYDSQNILFVEKEKAYIWNIYDKKYKTILESAEFNNSYLSHAGNYFFTNGEYYGHNFITIFNRDGKKISTLTCNGLQAIKSIGLTYDNKILFLANVELKKTNIFMRKKPEKSNIYTIDLDGKNLKKIDIGSYPIINYKDYK